MDRKLEILLVEDDHIVCEEMTDIILNSNDLTLIGVTNNAIKAIEYIKDKLPDAVILDLELHQGYGSGLNILQELHNSPPARMPYILVTTNNSSSMTYELARTLGADFIMSKHQEGYSNKSVLDDCILTKTLSKNNCN